MAQSSTVKGQPRSVGLKSALLMFVLFLLIGSTIYVNFFKPQQPRGLVDNEPVRSLADAVASGIRSVTAEVNQSEKTTKEVGEQVTQQIDALEKKVESVIAPLREQLDRFERFASTAESTGKRSYVEVIALHKTGQRIRTELKALRKLRNEWQAKIRGLETTGSENGRRIAAVPEHIDIFEQLVIVERPDELTLSTWDEQLFALLTRVNQAYEGKNDNFVVSPEDVTVVERIGRQIHQALVDIERDTTLLDVLIEESPDDVPGGTPSLKTARELRRKQLSSLRKKRVAEEIRRAIEQTSDELGKERAETERLLLEVLQITERLGRDARLGSERLDAADQAQRIQGATEEQRRRAESRRRELQALGSVRALEQKYQRQLPEIRRLLVPFISKGRRQVDGQRWSTLAEPAPLSLSGVRASKALNDDHEGYAAFLWIAGGPYNDRPNGSFRSTIGGRAGDGEIPDIRRGQELLTEFGDLMVNNGLLVP